MSKLAGRQTVGSTPYVFCVACGGPNTAWDRPVMQKDRITYRSRRCSDCRRVYRVAILVVDKNPTTLAILSAYHDNVQAGSNTEVIWEGDDE
mgnify:CR=1 FL=1